MITNCTKKTKSCHNANFVLAGNTQFSITDVIRQSCRQKVGIMSSFLFVANVGVLVCIWSFTLPTIWVYWYVKHLNLQQFVPWVFKMQEMAQIIFIFKKYCGQSMMCGHLIIISCPCVVAWPIRYIAWLQCWISCKKIEVKALMTNLIT